MLPTNGGRGMESLILPSAIQRIRSFLVEICGMKVKPWASTEETLAALHTTLVARHKCQFFWTSLCGLLETLARDLVARQAALPGSLVDNELLDSERYATLLDEIRAALAVQAAEPATFRRLASALSAPALGLLLLLGGAATVGCDSSALHGPTHDAGLPGVTDATVTQPASTPDVASIPVETPDASPDTPLIAPDALVPLATDALAPNPDVALNPVEAPDASPDLSLSPDASPSPDRSLAHDAESPDLSLSPDASPDTSRVAPDALASRSPDGLVVTQSDGATVTIQDIMQSCNMSAQAVLDCLARLRASWTTGMAEALAGKDCQTISNDISCFLQNTCSGAPSSSEFNPYTAFYCPPIPIYVGVRFV